MEGGGEEVRRGLLLVFTPLSPSRPSHLVLVSTGSPDILLAAKE